MVCPCEIELKSDTLVKVSFSLARIYDATDIDSIEVSVAMTDEQFGSGVNAARKTFFELPELNELKSYDLLLPLKYTKSFSSFTEIRVAPKKGDEYVGPRHYRALSSALKPPIILVTVIHQVN